MILGFIFRTLRTLERKGVSNKNWQPVVDRIKQLNWSRNLKALNTKRSIFSPIFFVLDQLLADLFL